MSLINDALKRAKAAQKQVSTPAPDLPLRPVEPSQLHARHDLAFLLPAALALVALLALLFVWRYVQTRLPGAPPEVAVRATAPAGPPQTDWSTPPPSTPAPAAAVTDAAPVSLPPEDTTSPFAAAAQGTEPTNAAPVVAPAPPQPAPLRLQGIFFNPRRPSAVISGKTVFVGDKLGQFRVAAIGRETATLVGSTQTNVLSLSD